jgi:hypothetical protein
MTNRGIEVLFMAKPIQPNISIGTIYSHKLREEAVYYSMASANGYQAGAASPLFQLKEAGGS